MSRIQICPNCEFSFDIGYGRSIACSGCAESVTGQCEFVKCPRCGEEFKKDHFARWNHEAGDLKR